MHGMADFAGMDEQSQQRIAELEEQLARVQEEAAMGQKAIAIVNQGIEKGELEQREDGSIVGSKRRSDTANVIGNMEEL